MDIFGVMLTFHGMVIFVQDGRFRQLLVKACAALLVGWHVYALLLAFIVFGLARETVARLNGRSDSNGNPHMWNIHKIRGGGWKYHLSVFASLIRSRYTILGAATLAFGIVVLGSNLVNEYYAYGGETPPAELPSLASALRRAALDAEPFNLPRFAGLQLFRAGVSALPYALPWKYGYPAQGYPALSVVLVGILAVGAALVGAALARRYWTLWAALALSGFFWAALMRGNAAIPYHEYEAMHYVGVPLALFGTALMGARRLRGEGAPVAAALAAVVVFAVSVFQIQTGGLRGDEENPETLKAEIADFDIIREKTRGEAVAVLSGAFDVWLRHDRARYYLTGSVLLPPYDNPTPPRMGGVKYVVAPRDYEWGYPLTPQNRVAFLYEVELFHLPPAELRRVESAEPTARSDFDLYLDGYALTYLKAPCEEDDARGRFFLSVHPVNLADLPQDRREIGHDTLNFDFSPHGITRDGKCAIRRQLPSYRIAAVSTGQYIPDADEIWSAEIRLPPSEETAAHYETVYAAAKSSGKRIIRSDFDVYMDAHALTYVKEPCAESDTHGEFFLDVYPVKPEDLSEDRRERGFDDLAFDFYPSGKIFGGKCMARREIPGYAIAEIETGMRVPDEGEIWSAEINLPLSAESVAYYDAIYQAAKSYGEPLIRSDFDVYMEGGTLTYLKAPCANYDTRGRFFLSVHPVDITDLPEDRREIGHDGLNFDFAPSGIVFDNKCMISRELPDYPVSKISTGQWIPGGDRLWAGEATMGE